MTNSGIKCHTEESWVHAIHRLFQGASICRVAVSYCGAGGYKYFPEHPADRAEDLRIVVDASETAVKHGLTNPDGLDSLLGLTSNVRSLKSLHSKVLIFDRRAVLVGSMNMSDSSRRQFQFGVEISQREAVSESIRWFDAQVWQRAELLDTKAVLKLRDAWPKHPPNIPMRPKSPMLPDWKHGPPEPALVPQDFELAVSRQNLKKMLAEFKSNVCKYSADGDSCAAHALENEKKYNDLSRELHALWRHRASWGKVELKRVFDLAYTNGKAAQIIKPQFARQKPAKVVRTLEYLFEGDGDPYVRFEKVVSAGSRYKLVGLSQVGAICLLHLWSPNQFALLAGPVDKALKKLVHFPRSISFQKGQGFKDRTAAVSRLASLTGLKTFGRVDHFLDAIGKGHIHMA